MTTEKQTKILRWYAENKRTFPWRREGISAYEVWVSEIMLQQTQVSRGVVFYERFLKKFPTVQKLAKATWEDFLPYYEGLGYYNRGRNMLKAARVIVENFGGEFPRDKAALMKLPGVGEYTASAILSFAWNEPYIAFDTNFKKIFETREKAEKAFRESGVASSVFNSAVMDYASAQPKITNAKRNCGQRSPLKEERSAAKRRGKGRPWVVISVVVLHENHKKFFSQNKKQYKPFTMASGISSREQIKKYFLEKYSLRLSVRPPLILKGISLINAQILLGAPPFAIFDKKSYDKWRTDDRAISSDG